MRWVFSGLVFLAWVSISAAPLPCVPAASDDLQPWVHISRVLESFPPDVPKPEFLGRFSDSNSEYQLHVWRDSSGIFGELLSPVREVDSPVSRLYEAQLDAKSGALSFTARFRWEQRRFTGQLRGDVIRGEVERFGKKQAVVLRRPQSAPTTEPLEESVTSRAQFECQMTLFHRY